MAPSCRARFEPADRLLQRRDFLRVYQEGRRISDRSFLLFYLQGRSERHRIGLTVPRKLGIAVRRNRVKRRLREVFRLHRQLLGNAPLDIVVNVSERGLDASHEELERGFTRAAAAARDGLGRPPRPRPDRNRDRKKKR